MQTVVRPKLPIEVTALRTLRHGPRDPSIRVRAGEVWRAVHTPLGAATVCYAARGNEFVVDAWGPGAAWCIETAPDVLGARDCLDGWEPGRHGIVAELDRRMPAMRMIATHAVMEAAIPTVLEQKVTSEEAHDSWRKIVWRWGEEAPGPLSVRLPPTAQRLSGEPYWRYHAFGIESKRADIVRRLASRPKRVEEALSVGRSRLEAFAGVGEWTSAKVAQVAWADADAVPVGDYHLAAAVVYALTGRRNGDDDAMMELLEPFAPHRGRAASLIKAGFGAQPRRAPRARLRNFAST